MGPNNSVDPITLAATAAVPVIGNTSKNTGAADGQFQKLLDQYANSADKPAQPTQSTPDKPQSAADHTKDTTTDQSTSASDEDEATFQEEAPKAEDDPLEQMKKLAEYGYVLARPENTIGSVTLNGQEYGNDEYYIGWKGDHCVVIPDSGMDPDQLKNVLNGQDQTFSKGDEFSGILRPPPDPLNPGKPLSPENMVGEPVTENIGDIMAKANAEMQAEAESIPQDPLSVAVRQLLGEDDSSKTETQVNVTGHESAPAVFQNLQSTPIKVGESYPTENVKTTEDVSDQLAQQIIPAVEQGQNKVELQLTPENLGSVKVEITQSENGSLHVAISAQNSEARNLLEKNADGLQNLLAARSQAPVQVEVQRQEESQSKSYDGQNGHPSQEQQQQQQRQSEQAKSSEDFLHQLRLGLVDETEDAF